MNTSSVTSTEAGAAAEKAGFDDGPATASSVDSHVIESDLLVEDVSIDGMCGVY